MVKGELKRVITKEFKENYQLYILILLPLAFLGLFSFGPMYGLQIAFKKYTISKGILGSPWVGFKNFETLFNNFMFFRAFKNTLLLSIYSIIAGFPIPIMLALALNATTIMKLKKSVQMVTYAPYFISTVVMVGIILQFTDTRSGIVNQILGVVGIEPIHFMGNVKLFFLNIRVDGYLAARRLGIDHIRFGPILDRSESLRSRGCGRSICDSENFSYRSTWNFAHGNYSTHPERGFDYERGVRKNTSHAKQPESLDFGSDSDLRVQNWDWRRRLLRRVGDGTKLFSRNRRWPF